MVTNTKYKYKPYVIQILFLLVIFLAFFNIYKILEIGNDILHEQTNNIEQSKNIINYEQVMYSNINIKVEYPIWYECILYLIEAMLYLFVGGLIYARNYKTFE